ncbi:Outer membrane efflux protein [Pirellula sp. SH-Sr6A]|uniref:TolC family protein n=1 Tax=Pirellula sp. SH-Sr6A TaxID=1632865 RepID=UPI00078CE965|nr:TolC family protein [Pirellula sp. SH-Sr6A]AMV32885.1 Outer membrane efflux protein [Pirellula sp. SH-Sr6A]
MVVREQLRKWIVAGCVGVSCIAGCKPTERFRAWKDNSNVSYFQDYVTRIEYPDVAAPLDPQLVDAPLPLAIENPSDLPTYDLTLQDAIQQALQTSEVLRNLGGSVVNAPQAQSTQLDPALSDVNPLGGVEAALAAFDAQVSSQLYWQKNDRPNNNTFIQFVPSAFRQTSGTYVNELSKRTATGASYALRTNVIYDRNNNPTRFFPSDFTGFIEAEWRQPLMRGAGTTYNRIAGPNGQIGQYNGVLIARINTDISIADFETGVVRLINDVEGAYWELYFAYRALDAIADGRESSLKTWQRVNELRRVGRKGGEPDAEGQARSNFYIFTSQLNDGLSGPNGLYAAEQRLRYIMGLPPSDGRLIKPSDEPLQAEVAFDWQSAMSDALTQRVEVRRQEWTVKRRELELIAARLNRRPRLDALTQYRWRGLGDHLIDERDPNNEFNSFSQSLLEGNYQEWQAGLEWQYNIGLRQASAAVRHAQLNLAREMALLKEQQLRISHDLSNASRQISRSYLQMQTNYNRIEADNQAVEALRQRYEGGLTDIVFLLQAQQRLATSTSDFYRSLVDYNLALRDFHREKGSLLSYNQVNLSEDALDGSAVRAAYDRGRYFTPRDNPEEVVVGGRVSNGAFDPSTVGTPSLSTPVVEAVPTPIGEE